ncbi:MAG: DUF3048 domain-containing protein [Lachnospiraceae bacterium]|jgi:hypothetical protein
MNQWGKIWKWAAAVSIAAVLGMTGCSGKGADASATLPQETAETTKAEPTTAEIEIHQETTKAQPEELDYYRPEERIEENGKVRSYLTGELVDAKQGNRRPLAIMMSNDKQALPQYGINRAGVVYEAPVEGTMNRYMALIEDFDDLERIGSVRSCRTYYTYFAREFEAIYAHFGQSTFAKPYLGKVVANINGIEGVGSSAFYRTKDRKAPHNAYTSGKKILETGEKLGYTWEYPDSYQGHYRFAKGEVTLKDCPGVMDASSVKPGYPLNQPEFVYDKEDGLYHRYQYGAVHSGDEGPIAVKNVLIQWCQWGHYASTDYLNINVHTGSGGYYITNGKAIPITWEKDGEYGVTHYYDQNQEEILLNPGKTWVCIIATKDAAQAVKIEG